MTYILLMAKGRDRARFAACVRKRGPVTFCSDWGRPAGLADRATHLVIGMAPGGGNARWLRSASGSRAAFPRVGLVLGADAGSLRDEGARAASIADAVVGPDPTCEELLGALDAAIVRGPLRELAADAARLPDGAVPRAVRAAMEARAPFRTVNGLARHTHSAPNTLSRGWPDVRRALRLGDGLHLRDLLNWRLLVRGVVERRCGAPDWRVIVHGLEVSPRRLSRASSGPLELTLPGLDRVGAEEMAMRARAAIRGPAA